MNKEKRLSSYTMNKLNNIYRPSSSPSYSSSLFNPVLNRLESTLLNNIQENEITKAPQSDLNNLKLNESLNDNNSSSLSSSISTSVASLTNLDDLANKLNHTLSSDCSSFNQHQIDSQVEDLLNYLLDL